MKQIDAATAAALASGAIVPRDFLTLTVRDRATGDPVEVAWWSGLGTVDAAVIDPDTGSAVSRTYTGKGTMIETTAVSLVTGFAVQSVDMLMSHLTDEAMQAIRGYDPRRGRVELHRGLLDPTSRLLVAPALPFFLGEIDAAPIEQGAEGGEGRLTLTAISHAQELTRSNPATRSDADQRKRDPSDGFFRHAATVGTWRVYWGQKGEEA